MKLKCPNCRCEAFSTLVTKYVYLREDGEVELHHEVSQGAYICVDCGRHYTHDSKPEFVLKHVVGER